MSSYLGNSSYDSDAPDKKTFSLTYRIPSPHKHFTRLVARHAADLEFYDQTKNCNNLKSCSISCLPKDLSLDNSDCRLNQSCSALERFVGDHCSTMDYEQICGRSRKSSYSGWMKYLFYLFLGLIVLWYVNGRIEESRGSIEDFHTDLCDVKSQMSVIQNGYEKDTKQRLSVMQRDTQHKLEAIETLLNEIKKNQQAHPSRHAEGSSGESSASPLLHINRDDPTYQMVRQVLQEYDADKTGKVDFALESAGGSIVSSGNTEPYSPTGSSITLFGIPLCSSLHGPRAMLQASSLPGECWAFKGSQGSAVIRLLGPVIIHCVSLEHISRTISPSGEIDSAPKDFSIWGLVNGEDAGRGRKLGDFSYDINGPPIQFFPIGADEAFEYVEFKVQSNHGNPVYTCVYRLRVHGQLDSLV